MLRDTRQLIAHELVIRHHNRQIGQVRLHSLDQQSPVKPGRRRAFNIDQRFFITMIRLPFDTLSRLKYAFLIARQTQYGMCNQINLGAGFANGHEHGIDHEGHIRRHCHHRHVAAVLGRSQRHGVDRNLLGAALARQLKMRLRGVQQLNSAAVAELLFTHMPEIR